MEQVDSLIIGCILIFIILATYTSYLSYQEAQKIIDLEYQLKYLNRKYNLSLQTHILKTETIKDLKENIMQILNSLHKKQHSLVINQTINYPDSDILEDILEKMEDIEEDLEEEDSEKTISLTINYPDIKDDSEKTISLVVNQTVNYPEYQTIDSDLKNILEDILKKIEDIEDELEKSPFPIIYIPYIYAP